MSEHQTHQPSLERLRVIPVSKHGWGISFPPARTDEEEESIRAKAEAGGFLSGKAMYFPRPG
jgi:hypothetical protein